MSVKGAGNKSVAGDDNKSIFSDRVNLIDLDYYSITEHITEKELFTRIRNFSQGYLESATLSILNSRIHNSIASIPIIPSVTSTDRIEDVGHRVYLTIQELLRAVDAQLFPLIVALNFDYQSWIFECREARIAFKTEYDSLKQITDTPLDKPTTEVYDLRADLQIHDFCENLNSESYQPGPFGSTTPSDRAAQIADTIAKESARIKMDSRRQFLKAFDAWELSKKHQNDAVSQLRTLEQDVKKHTAVESVLEAFLTADRLIVSNLQNAIISRYPALCPILKESITIPATREEITHPWDLKNLAGMAAIIYNQYHKPSFITFNNNLIKAMSFQISADDTKSNPMKAVSGVQDLISTWDTHNLWAQMSPDHFWSAVLLRSLNSHALFRDVLQKTQEFIRTHQHDPPSGRLPIFTYTSTYIQNLQSDKTFNSGKPTSTSDKPPYPGRSTHNQYKSQSLPAGVEQAAAATAPTVPAKAVSIAATPTSGSTAARPTASTTSSTGGPNPRTNPKGKTIYSTPIKTYQGPVHKGHKVFIDTHSPPNHPDNRPFRYLAVPHRTDVCEKCFATEPTPCSTPCAADYCSSCTLFGHKSSHCMQLSSSGVAKDAAKR